MGDVLAHFMRTRGHSAAMERKVDPRTWTYENIAAMKKQLQTMGLSLDWSREFAHSKSS